ncbi:uncharacterized protein EAE97_011566 [Botrytis byssoidea]|uniref:Uncharacterized protein n=1 Tax=Botrytis byssoidea TaxID=139641 RepID=A0A9P5LQJ9_9HELO|nr:uncharacterized protein EAE97_011566 [Botrytis byssoidea]KAF7920225.1 hypothetical protein EAE97_011566 [Botrytis byssoidea]
MSPINLVLRTAFILSSISTSFAAICNGQTRASGDPSGEILAAFLNSQDQISQFCSAGVSGKTSGDVNFSDFQISFERSDSFSSTLEHCTKALQDIISRCIKPSDPGTYGESSTFESGETYTISNDLYPQAPVVSVNLENRAVEDAAKARTHKTTAKPTTKTTKTIPKTTTVAQATTTPKTTATTPKPTPTSVTTSSKTTQTTSTTSKSSTSKTSLSSETPKTTATSTSSKTIQTVPTTSKPSISTITTSIASETPKTTSIATTSKSTTSSTISSKIPSPSSLSSSQTSTKQSSTGTSTSTSTNPNSNPHSATSSSLSTLSSISSIKGSSTHTPTLTPSAPTSTKPSPSNIPSSLSTTQLSTSSLEVSSHIPELTSTPSQSTSTEPVSLETSSQKSTSQADPSSSSSIHTSGLSSTSSFSSGTKIPISKSLTSTSHPLEPTPSSPAESLSPSKLSVSPESSETTPATISELPSSADIHPSPSSAIKTSSISSLSSNSIPEITPGPTTPSSSAIITSGAIPSTSVSELTSQVISTETHIASKPSEITPSPSPSTVTTQVISTGPLTSSIQPEITLPSSESSLSRTISSTIISEAISKSTSTEALTSSTKPEITPSSPVSEEIPQSISTSSSTSSTQPEITPAPSNPSTSELNPSTPETKSTSQAISTGSLTSPVEPEITPPSSPSPSETSEPSKPTEASGPAESPDPIETSQPETPENNPTETAIPSSTPAPLSTSIASSPACTATTGGNCSTCYQYSGSGDISLSLSNSTTLQSRKLPPTIAGRISTTDLQSKVSKRATRSFTSFDAANSCVFGSVDVPSIPDASTLVSKAGTQTEYWYVLQDTPVNATICPALGFTKVTDAALASQLINSNAVGYTKAGSGIGWKTNAPTVDVDSVYDSIILQSFFASRVNSSNFAAFKAIFDQSDTVNAGKSRLQTIWNALPSDTNPDYAGIDQKISTVKAQAFTAVAMAITNNDAIANLFQSTNLRVYKALLAIDAVIGATNSTTTAGIKADWASTYRTYLTNFLTTRSSIILSQVSSYLDNDLGPAARNDNVTLSDGTVSTTEDSIGKGVDALLNAYPLATAFAFDQAKLLGFPSV